MLVVVGGHSRNIGKTSLVVGLIRKLRHRKWTAIKITQYGHGVCSQDGKSCECSAGTDVEHPYSLSEEYEPSSTDSGRFLAAGAERSFWLRTPAGELSKASATLEKLLRQGDNVIVESNSVVELVKPDVFLMLLDFGCEDFKASSLRLMDRADAYVVVDRGINAPVWADISQGLWDNKPQFLVKPPNYVTTAVSSFVRDRICPV